MSKLTIKLNDRSLTVVTNKPLQLSNQIRLHLSGKETNLPANVLFSLELFKNSTAENYTITSEVRL